MHEFVGDEQVQMLFKTLLELKRIIKLKKGTK